MLFGCLSGCPSEGDLLCCLDVSLGVPLKVTSYAVLMSFGMSL